MSDDADTGWWRPVWEEPDEAPAPASSGLPGWLPALVRAQDAIARLEAGLEGAPDDVAHGVRARVALHEASGILACRRMRVHPHDLALRTASLTGSYSAALLTGKLAAALPASSRDAPVAELPDDWLVERALAYARLWRRLAERSTWQPLRDPAALATALGELGEPVPDPQALAPWLAALRRPAGRVALHMAAGIVAAGLPGAAEAAEAPGLGASFTAACLWRHAGFGRPVALAFWSAPLVHVEAVARDPGSVGAYLECVAEAALRARRDLARLQAAERRAAALPATARSHLGAATGFALREPVVTATRLAAGIGVSSRAGLDLIGRLVAAGLLREVTGRASWRAFVVA